MEAGTSRPANDAAPDFLAHWVVKTARLDEMTTWYRKVFGARVVPQDRQGAFLSGDREHHLLADRGAGHPAVPPPAGPAAAQGPRDRPPRRPVASLEKLLTTYERLERAGIRPVWSINHGPTTSLYYEDPDGIRLEFQVDNFPTADATAAYFAGEECVANPIGTEFDSGYLLERLRRGDDPAELFRPGAGTRPGTTPRANKRAITWKTL
ncbi:VOC family protein [Amycolatopsis sp. NPDC004169]|uniref:VOC family protein n=1 Tax=Amycolatopsis sp. NPDC004169 TaxID=3154453 RepID=UPI0033A024FE